MRLTEAGFDLMFLDGSNHTREQQQRGADHPHVSTVINDLANRLVHKGERKPYDEVVGVDRYFMERMTDMGFMFEETLNNGLIVPKQGKIVPPEEAINQAFKARMIVRRQKTEALEVQKELLVEGFYMNPDARNLGRDRGEEYKATWKSMKKMLTFLKDFIEWYWQIGAYCRGLHVVTYDLFVYWVNGDYQKTGYRPVTKVYTLEYEPDEINQIWTMLKKHRDFMLSQGLLK